MDDIRFNDSGKKIYISIDNERQDIPIETIDRFKTFIMLDQSLNTPLKEKITLKASLKYLPYDITDEDLSYTDYADIEVDGTDTTVDIEDNLSVEYTWTSGAEVAGIYPNSKQIDSNGVVTVTIYNGKKIYYQNDIAFSKGNIEDVIPNTLPVGEYQAVISFGGNKYLEPTSVNVDFNIEKRLAFFTFDNNSYYGEPTENISISGQLRDLMTEKTIKNCLIKFDFNGTVYSTRTDIEGYAWFDITIPDTDASHCLLLEENYIESNNNEEGEPYEDEPEVYQDFDDDGNIIEVDELLDEPFVQDDYSDTHGEESDIFFADTESDDIEDEWDYGYESVSYLLTIFLDSESYYVENTSASVIVNKLPTYVSVNQISDVIDNHIDLHGQVRSRYKNEDKNVGYGKVITTFDNTDYSNEVIVNNYGDFDISINFSDINLANNTSELTQPIVYEQGLYQSTVTEITTDSQVEIGNPINAVVNVHPINSMKPIEDGMVVFILKANDREIYRYASQIDSTGKAVFFFNTSKKDIYTIHAYYYGLFGYNDSESQVKTIEVI